MIKIYGERGCGKTTRLIEIAKREGYVLVEPNARMADYAKRMAKEKGYDIKIIASYELLRDTMGHRKRNYLIDELDMFLESIGVIGFSDDIE